jgi:hypothetical protein
MNMPQFARRRLAATLGWALAAAQIAALPAPAQAALSQTYAALFDNGAGAAAKMVTGADLRTYVTQRLQGQARTLITGLIDQHGFDAPGAIRVRLAAATAVAPGDSISAMVALPAVQVQGPQAATPWVGLPAGDDRRDALVGILKAINLVEQNASIVNPQIARQRSGTYANFSIEFVQKHAAANDEDAIKVARARFQQAGNFAGQPVPPISQNLDAGPFKDFAQYVGQMAGANVFTAAEAQVAGMRDALIAQLESVESVQYITPDEYMVRTYNPGGPGGATRAGNAQQHVQFAFTRSTQQPQTLIVNHMATPVGNNPMTPAPGGANWHQLNLANNNTRNRPNIFYETAPLANRGDL